MKIRLGEIPASLMPSACQEGFHHIDWRRNLMYQALWDFAHQQFHVTPSLLSGLRKAVGRYIQPINNRPYEKEF